MRSLAPLLVASLAAADPLVGTVVGVEARWAGDRIVSDADVALDDGTRTRVRVLGGTVGGVAMRVAGLPVLEAGERAALWLDGAWLRARVTLARRRAFTRVLADASGTPVRWWDTNCVTLVPDAAGSEDVDDGSDLDALRRAADAWAAAAGACAHLRVAVGDARADLRGQYHPDGPFENVVVWLEEEWGRPEEDVPYPANRTALTTLFYIDDPTAPDDGRLLDADVELNGVDWRFTTGACDASDQTADVENTLAHELGHVMGLDHTCDSGAGEAPVDNEGRPLPSCGSAPKEVVETTLFANAPRCATYMRTPEADDVVGLCTIYPLADDPEVCAQPALLAAPDGDDGGWCAIARRPASPGALAPLALVALLALGRRPRDYGRVSRRVTRASISDTRSRNSRTSRPAVSRKWSKRPSSRPSRWLVSSSRRLVSSSRWLVSSSRRLMSSTPFLTARISSRISIRTRTVKSPMRPLPLRPATNHRLAAPRRRGNHGTSL